MPRHVRTARVDSVDPNRALYLDSPRLNRVEPGGCRAWIRKHAGLRQRGKLHMYIAHGTTVGEEQSRVINMGDVLPAAAFVIEKNSLKWFVIKADGNTEYQHVDRVMEQLRQANVRNIAMLTGQEEVG